MLLCNFILQFRLRLFKLIVSWQLVNDESPRFIGHCAVESSVVVSDVSFGLGL